MSKQSFDPAQKAPTLVQVARLAGVGIGTASRVLNQEGYVSEATAAKVRAVIAQIGYTPNEVARSLKVRRSGAIGIVVPDLGDPFIASCVQSAQSVIRQSGNIAVLTFSQGLPEIEVGEIAYLTRRQIDGILILPAGGPADHLSEEALRGVPLVAFDRPVPGRHIDSVLVENRKGAATGVQHLVDHGHKRIAFLGPENYSYTMEERLKGYAQVMQKAGLVEDVLLVPSTSQDLEPVVSGWLASKNRPTAVFSGNGLTSICLLKALAKFGVRVPGQLAMVGFDDLQLGDLLDPPLTVVRQPAVQLAAGAASLLLQRVAASHTTAKDDPKPTTQHILLATELIVRSSCGAHPGP